MHYGNTTFIYQKEFNKYMKIEGATFEEIFDYLFDSGAEKIYQKKKRHIYISYLNNGIQSILSLMKTLMII